MEDDRLSMCCGARADGKLYSPQDDIIGKYAYCHSCGETALFLTNVELNYHQETGRLSKADFNNWKLQSPEQNLRNGFFWIDWAARQCENKIKVLGPSIHPAAKIVLEEVALAIRAGIQSNILS